MDYLLLRNVIFILIGIVWSVGCSPFNFDRAMTKMDATAQRFCGKVIFVPLEGGFYGLESHNGHRYLPRNLPENLQQNGLPIQMYLIKEKGIMGIQMWGDYVRILSIKPEPC